jgi:hypothetical protein
MFADLSTPGVPLEQGVLNGASRFAGISDQFLVGIQNFVLTLIAFEVGFVGPLDVQSVMNRASADGFMRLESGHAEAVRTQLIDDWYHA